MKNRTRYLLLFRTLILGSLFPAVSLAQSSLEGRGRILQVHKILALEKNSKMTQREFVTNLGSESGVILGTYLDIYRRVPVSHPLDPSVGQDLKVFVGQIEVNHVENSLSVGRLRAMASPKDHPMLEHPFPMAGDSAEIGRSSSRVERFERVPGMISAPGKMKKDAQVYLQKVTRYIRKRQHEITAIHLHSPSRAAAARVADRLEKGVKGVAIHIHRTPSAKKLPARGVVILLERS